MPHDTTRWTVSVSKETDITVRSFLAQRGMKKGDLSKFIEEAVNGACSTRPCRGPRASSPTCRRRSWSRSSRKPSRPSARTTRPRRDMRVRLVVDTNILISALLVERRCRPTSSCFGARAGSICWTSAEQLDELMRVTRYSKIRERLDVRCRSAHQRTARYRCPPRKPSHGYCLPGPTTTICSRWPLPARRIFLYRRQARLARPQAPRGHEDRHRARFPDVAWAFAMTSVATAAALASYPFGSDAAGPISLPIWQTGTVR